MMGSYQKNTDQTKPNQTKPNHNLSIVPPFHMEEEEGESDKAAERDKGEEIIKGGGATTTIDPVGIRRSKIASILRGESSVHQ